MFSMIKSLNILRKTDFNKHSEQKLGPKAKDAKMGGRAFSGNETLVKIIF